jgi:NADPH2:quinone reductase
MRAVKIRAFGDADQLEVSELADLAPEEGQVVIKVEAIGVGLVDVLKRKGSLGGEPGFIPGSEVAGTVTAVGPDVDARLMGTRVFAQGGGGGYADQFLASASSLVSLPDHLSAEDAIALGLNALVAFFSQRQAHLKAGDHILIRGASGGIGLATVQAAVKAGAIVTAVTKAEAAPQIEAMGAHQVIRRDLGELPQGPFDVVIDPVGGSEIGELIGALDIFGRYVLVGAAAGFPEPSFGQALFRNFQKSPTFSVFSMASVSPDDVKLAAAKIFSAAERGDLIPKVAGIFALAEAPKAHNLLETGNMIGKIILRPAN